MAVQDLNELKRMETLSKAINHLGISMYQQLCEEDNVFFSPFSLSCALAMTFCGAKNETAREMKNVLGYEKLGIIDEQVKDFFKCLISAFDKTSESYSLNSANIVFCQQKFQSTKEFKNTIEEYFKAMFLEVDFVRETEKARKQANDWVKQKTNGMIPQLLDKLYPDTVLIILNAVYFKGFWLHQFKKNLTTSQKFYNKGDRNKAKKVKMMHMKKKLPYFEETSFKALQLHYKGDELAMLILLPNSCDGLKELENNVTVDLFQLVKSKLQSYDVDLHLPKFRLEYSKSMKQQFENLGMQSAFHSCKADFSGINGSPGLVISEIVHKAVVDVNEEGTEASAATAVIMGRSLPRYTEFFADHPFLFFIYNCKNDVLLFMGKVDVL